MFKLSDVTDLEKVSGKIAFLFAIITSIILFLTPYLPQLQLDKFVADYGKFVGVFWLLSVGLTLTAIFTWIINTIKYGNVRRARRKAIIQAMKDLDPNEKAVLREFLFNQGNTVLMPMNDAPVSGLIRKGILIRVTVDGAGTSMGGHDGFGIWMPFMLNDTMSKHFKPEMIDVPTKYDEETNRRLNDLRPEWAKFDQEMKNLGRRYRSRL